MYKKATFRGTNAIAYLYDSAIPALKLLNKKSNVVIASQIFIPPELFNELKEYKKGVPVGDINLYIIDRCSVLENKANDYANTPRYIKPAGETNPYNYYIVAVKIKDEFYRFKCPAKSLQLEPK